MDLHSLKSFDPSLHVERQGGFENCGFDLRSPLPQTLTYAGNAAFLIACAQRLEVSAILTTRAAFEESAKTAELSRRDLGLAFSPRPRVDFFLFHNYLAHRTDFYQRRQACGRGQGCRISPSASLAESNVLIGDRVVIGEGVHVGASVSIGDDTIIWPGTVIGNDGFQFERLDGKVIKIAHVGGVSIGREVEIKSNCCIDRHIFRDDTRIGDQTKFDNLVYVGHCTKIGRACLLGAHAAITGSVVIGDEVWVGPNATISSALTVGSQAAVSLGSVVTRDVPPGERVSGNFAIRHNRFLSFIRSIR